MAKSSQFKGVCKSCGKWLAYTGGGQNKVFHGSYDTEIEAAEVRNAMMIERFGFDPSPNVIPTPPSDVVRYSSTAYDQDRLIRQLAMIKQAGGGVVCIRTLPGESNVRLTWRVKYLVPLLKAQPYVFNVISRSDVPYQVDLELGGVREGGEPWIIADPKPMAKTIVFRKPNLKPINESYSYLNNDPDCLFLGTGLQLQIFRTQCKVDRLKFYCPDNLYEAAQIIAGSERFIGNRSVLSAIAEGCGICAKVEHEVCG